MGSVYKRTRKETTTWWISYYVAGKRFREPAGSTKALAVAKLAAIEKSRFEGTFYPEKKNSELTMEGLSELWLEHAAHKRSLVDDKQRFGAILAHFGKSRLLSSLEMRDVEKFKAELAKRETRRGKKMAPATVNRHLALLRSALRLADANGYFHRLKNIRLAPERNARDRIISEDEYARLIKAARSELRLAIILGYETAMRLGEILSLTWDRIDTRAGTVLLGSAQTKNGDGRIVPLSEFALEAVKSVPRRLNGSLFESKSNTISPAFGKLARSLGIINVRFHDTRHTCLTRLRRGGVDIITIAAISGHKTLAMVRRYQTINEGDLRAAIMKAGDAS